MFYPSTIGHRFMTNSSVLQQSVKVAAAQHEMIRQLALQGDCVIVGRCADVLCRDMNPLNIFVYADRLSKRAKYRELFTEEKWGRKEYYHLCINTSGKEIKTLVSSIAAYVNVWFEED